MSNAKLVVVGSVAFDSIYAHWRSSRCTRRLCHLFLHFSVPFRGARTGSGCG